MQVQNERSKETITLLPTHSCFDDMLDYFHSLAAHGRQDAHRLVHGIVLYEGREMSHAWILKNGVEVLQTFMKDGQKVLVGMPLKAFLATATPIAETRYTWEEAKEQNRVHGTLGPWVERYLILCRNYKEDVE